MHSYTCWGLIANDKFISFCMGVTEVWDPSTYLITEKWWYSSGINCVDIYRACPSINLTGLTIEGVCSAELREIWSDLCPNQPYNIMSRHHHNRICSSQGEMHFVRIFLDWDSRGRYIIFEKWFSNLQCLFLYIRVSMRVIIYWHFLLNYD